MLALLLFPTVFAFDTTNRDTANCPISDCLNYYDGCNNCFCNIQTGLAGCTLMYCDPYTSAFCTNCNKDRVWLVTDDQTSSCSCPEGEQVTDNGCELIDECPDASEQLLRCNYPTDDTECEYDGLSFRYQICQHDDACEDGFYCKKVEEDVFYETCTPIMCKLDKNCDPYDCVDDCVGIGWGTCVKNEDEFNCDKIPGCLSYNDGCDPDNALDECTMNICTNAIKSHLCVSDSDCKDGFECQTTDDMNFMEAELSDICVSLDCSVQINTCERYGCLSSCIDDNQDNVGRCVRGVNKNTNATSCQCAENLFDPYCCWAQTYTNPCLAKCDGIINAEKKCDKGVCKLEIESAHNVGLFGLTGTDNSRLYSDLQYNFMIVALQIVGLILYSLFVGIMISYYGINFKSVSVIVITIGAFIGVFIMMVGVTNKNGELYWNYQHDFVIVVMKIMLVTFGCLFVGVVMLVNCLSYNKQLTLKANKQILEDL